MINRPSIDNYFMDIAKKVATRSTCNRHDVGAVIVGDNKIISTGYNGAPKGLEHCIDIGCAREGVPSGMSYETCRAVHAEQNAIIQGSPEKMDGSTIYITHQPCTLCSKMIINAGIKRVVYEKDHDDVNGLIMLHEAKLQVSKLYIG